MLSPLKSTVKGAKIRLYFLAKTEKVENCISLQAVLFFLHDRISLLLPCRSAVRYDSKDDDSHLSHLAK